MRALFDHREDLTDSIVSFYFQPEYILRFSAGQFMELQLSHSLADARGNKRWFTISSSPNDPLIAITTRLLSSDGSSFKLALEALNPGAPVELSAPLGDFVLPKLLNQPIFFVAGGIGITPFVSMARWLAATHTPHQVRLVHMVRRPDDKVFGEAFAAAGIPVQYYENNRFNAQAVLAPQLSTRPDEALFYLSGAETVMRALETELRDAGIRPYQIVTDFFPGYNAA